MNTFTLSLHSARQSERIEAVESFVGEDASGSFGLKAGHERLMTVLVFGLARYRCQGQDWRYLAVPGGVLRFADNQLVIATRRYLQDSDYTRISTALTEQLLREEDVLSGLKQQVQRLEQAMLQQLIEIERGR